MTIFSLYIFDRHCECVYYQDWHRTRPLRPPSLANLKPGVHRLPLLPSTPPGSAPNHAHGTASIPGSGGTDPRESIFSKTSGGSVNGYADRPLAGSGAARGLPFDEEAKLVYGVVLSLRNMVKKLSGRDESFTSYRTPYYKLHLYETMTGYKFVLLSDPASDSLRFVLRQLYTGPFVDYVVRNPMVQMDSRTEGVDNDQFRSAVDRHMRSLSMFGG